MIKESQKLERHYDCLLSRFPARDAGDYSSLVVPSGNSAEPFHRWFHVKEAYSYALIPRLLKDYGILPAASLRVLDPFAGSGTTALAVAELVRDGQLAIATVRGVERNPFLQLLASTKARAVQLGADGFEFFAAGLVASAESRVEYRAAPSLSTFSNPSYITPEMLIRLLKLRDTIDDEAARSDPLLTDLARICLASAVEPSSMLRRDGRTMRYVPSKNPVDPVATFSMKAQQIADDLDRPNPAFDARIIQGDARRTTDLPSDEFDAVVFSPPYPNNIDYSEVYKLESWILGLVGDQDAFSSLRRGTLRSHGSLRWEDNYRYEISENADAMAELLSPLLACIPNDRYTRSRTQLVRGYFDDMLSVLAGCAATLSPGGLLAFVVGNSMHGKKDEPLLIAADVLLAAMCEMVGLEVAGIEVARTPPRRRSESKHLRESVVVARKAVA